MAWSTPIPELLLAYESKIEFLRATNPFGSGEDEKKGATKAGDMKAMLRAAGK